MSVGGGMTTIKGFRRFGWLQRNARRLVFFHEICFAGGCTTHATSTIYNHPPTGLALAKSAPCPGANRTPSSQEAFVPEPAQLRCEGQAQRVCRPALLSAMALLRQALTPGSFDCLQGCQLAGLTPRGRAEKSEMLSSSSAYT